MTDKKKILILPGDGIGPEVCTEAKKVLVALNDKFQYGIAVSYTHLTLPTN